MKTSINKFLLFLVSALLIINIVLALLLWSNKSRTEKSHTGKKSDWIARELKLDDNQKEAHKKMRDAHFTRFKPVMDSITSARSKLYNLLDDSTPNDSLFNKYLSEIGNNQSRVSSYAFEHFRELRAICDQGQKIKLDSIIQRIVRDIGKRGTKPSGK